MVRAFDAGKQETEACTDPVTIAAGLRVPTPYAGREVLSCLRASAGTAVTVSEEALKAGALRLARDEGIAAAPEAGATLAALSVLLDRKLLDRGERVVLFLTGGASMYLDVLEDEA